MQTEKYPHGRFWGGGEGGGCQRACLGSHQRMTWHVHTAIFKMGNTDLLYSSVIYQPRCKEVWGKWIHVFEWLSHSLFT